MHPYARRIFDARQNVRNDLRLQLRTQRVVVVEADLALAAAKSFPPRLPFHATRHMAGHLMGQPEVPKVFPDNAVNSSDNARDICIQSKSQGELF